MAMMPDAGAVMEAELPDFRGMTSVEGAGHWVQQENPVETNASLLHFLSDVG
jgi:pimeloyl-ACP methyl ester carboxylesterase